MDKDAYDLGRLQRLANPRDAWNYDVIDFTRGSVADPASPTLAWVSG